MHTHVHRYTPVSTEPLKTMSTLTQSTRVTKLFAAFMARQGLLICVDKHMLVESLLGRESLVADIADMGLVWVTSQLRTQNGERNRLTLNVGLHVSLDLASLWEASRVRLATGTLVPTTAKA